MSELLEKVVGHIEGSLSKPICKLDAELDCRSDVVRVAEVSVASTRSLYETDLGIVRVG